MSSLRRLLRWLRYTQPFNFVGTGLVRGTLGALGLRSELAIKHLHRVGPVSSRLPNGRVLRLWSRADDWVSNQVFWRGWRGYEPETTPLFFRLASAAQVTLDVGGYVGFFALLAGHANPSGRVLSFEPLPRAFRRLQANVSRNRLPNVECIPSAVGREPGEARFFHSERDSIPTSSSLSHQFMRDVAGLTSSVVPVLALDDVVRDRSLARVDLVKVDTESTEPDVLAGAGRTLGRDRPDVFCEVLPGAATGAPLASLLRPLSYRFFHLTPAGPVERDTIEGHTEWLNYLFTTRDAASVARLWAEAASGSPRGTSPSRGRQ